LTSAISAKRRASVAMPSAVIAALSDLAASRAKTRARAEPTAEIAVAAAITAEGIATDARRFALIALVNP
jgi:hypothetical protein